MMDSAPKKLFTRYISECRTMKSMLKYNALFIFSVIVKIKVKKNVGADLSTVPTSDFSHSKL